MFKFITISTLVLIGSSLVNAAPTFSSSAVVSQPTPGQNFHGKIGGSFVVASVTIQSTKHFVQIVGEPANASVGIQYSLYLVDTNGGDQADDFYSGPKTCDQTGMFYHTANGSGSLTYTDSFSAGTSQAAHGGSPFTVHAVTDLYDLNDLTQKSHTDDSVKGIVVYP